MTSLSTDFTDKLFADYEANAKYSAIENAVTHNGLLKSIETRQSEVENDHVFSIDLTKDEVSNQKASGRCWMFAALNTFRHKLISDFKLESFELSQAHTFFWDKYEKSNWFLEQIMLQQIKRLAVVRLNSFWIPLNKMVDNGIWSYHFLKNMVLCQNQFIQNL